MCGEKRGSRCGCGCLWYHRQELWTNWKELSLRVAKGTCTQGGEPDVQCRGMRRGPVEASSSVAPGARHRGVVGGAVGGALRYRSASAGSAESSAVRNNTTLKMFCSEPLCSHLCKSHALCTCISRIHLQASISVSRVSSPTLYISPDIPSLPISRRRLLRLVPIDRFLRLGNCLECDLFHLSTSPDPKDKT